VGTGSTGSSGKEGSAATLGSVCVRDGKDGRNKRQACRSHRIVIWCSLSYWKLRICVMLAQFVSLVPLCCSWN
jgi:hypothetical protein